ncbi:Gfo/Idh/MocA family protein [Paenibacillus sp. GXUN7292]|uniref:Gfo/Idh/MocA family protein n=1 Tax=Paenibacillus sp. GXUN7292 TaxID=3422499 RepID=UPI003D7E0073
MKAVLVGLGRFGLGWYKRLLERGMLAAVVDSNPEMMDKMAADDIPFYHTLEEALERVNVDFIVNVTPPHIHMAINRIAFERGIAVLCEKPIANDFEEAVESVKLAEHYNVPFMIAENYRFAPNIRTLKKLIEEGAIGQISEIDIRFHRYHPLKRAYPTHLLKDIGIHHLDMLRYLTGRESISVQAYLHKPIGSWEEEGAILSASLAIELEGGIAASYTGTIASHAPATNWPGNWRIDGTKGSLECIQDRLYLTVNGETSLIEPLSGEQCPDCLQEFLDALAEKRAGETNARDYLRTQALVEFAEKAHQAGRRIAIDSI